MAHFADQEPIVLTGIGIIASNGQDRETVWENVRLGKPHMRWLKNMRGLPDDWLFGAVVPMDDLRGQLKTLPLCQTAASEAMKDAEIDFDNVDPTRFGSSLCAHMGDTRNLPLKHMIDPETEEFPWWQQWLPNTTCSTVSSDFGICGPRTSYSTACASSLVCVQSAVRMLRDDQADIVMAGGADTIDPLFAAGFHRMGVLATHDDPNLACRPFDVQRNGFVMGEGAAVLILEKLSHALARNAKIYAEIRGHHALSQAHHVTGIDTESDTLVRLIQETIRKSEMKIDEVSYINAHGTGTEMNDRAELIGIRAAMGDAADQLYVSSTKSSVGHLVNAAGGIELAFTALALRDGYAPPTTNLSDPDPICTINCLPHLGQRTSSLQHALKVAVAFGGHLISVALSRWNDPATGRAPLPLDDYGRLVDTDDQRRAA